MANPKSGKDGWNKAGLAALILLAPGGFILGFTLAARHYGKRSSRRAARPDWPQTGERQAADDQGSWGGNQVLSSPAVDATSP
jgi:hypothetical protein